MARHKSSADIRYNIRRRAQREVTRIQRYLKAAENMTGQTRNALNRRLESLRADIEASRGRITDANRESIEAAVNRLSRNVPERGAQVGAGRQRTNRRAIIESRNAAFANELTRALHPARYGEFRSDLGRNSYWSARIFMNATQDYWMGYRPEQRAQRILQGLSEELGRPVETLEEAYNLTMSRNRNALRIAQRRQRAYDNNGAITDAGQGWALATDSDREITGMTIGEIPVVRW